LWLLPAVGWILFNAFKTVNLSYYRPTEDTDTWAYFQNIEFNMTGIPRVGFVYQHTYLLTNVSSTVDTGIWSLMTSAAGAFLDANIGQMPAGADAQVKLAMTFCDVLVFNYEHAAHNADLFKAYTDAFAAAKQRLQLLLRAA
ncbi:MAG: hypothetical protein QOJ29_4525, partial [Thermoleophilaceae bacterium]|nr:hypothetical protein [Thermoleophilaceae bacterium]